MATIHQIGSGETLQAAVARRLRGILAEVRMSKTEFSARLGWDRGYLYRRLSGETPFNVADLELIELSTSIRAEYLVGGHEPKLKEIGDDEPSAAIPDKSLLSGLNRRPFAYKRHALPARIGTGVAA